MRSVIKQPSSHTNLCASTEPFLRGSVHTACPAVLRCARLLETSGRLVGAQAGSDPWLMLLSFHGVNVHSHADPRLCLREIKF